MSKKKKKKRMLTAVQKKRRTDRIRQKMKGVASGVDIHGRRGRGRSNLKEWKKNKEGDIILFKTGGI